MPSPAAFPGRGRALADAWVAAPYKPLSAQLAIPPIFLPAVRVGHAFSGNRPGRLTHISGVGGSSGNDHESQEPQGWGRY